MHINKEAADIKKVAQSIGCQRASDPDTLREREFVRNLASTRYRDSYNKGVHDENALTSNPTLRTLANRSMADVFALTRAVESGTREGLSPEANHSASELAEFESVLRKLIRVRNVILRVNQAYIHLSAYLTGTVKALILPDTFFIVYFTQSYHKP